MRILLLNQWFEPEPALKGLSFAKALRDAGHEVRVLTGFPNYPGGKVYAGYRIQWCQQETIDGIRVTRVPLYPSHDRSRLGRILNYVSFFCSASFYGTFMGWRPDVIYVYHPPLTVGMAGAVIGMLRGVPFLLDIQDLWPDTLKATGMLNNARLLRIIGWFARWTYRRAAMILPQSPGFAQRLAQSGVPPEKMEMIYNWCNEEALSKRPETPLAKPAALEGKIAIGFAGTMGVAQALDSVLEAAAIVQSQREDIALFFVGGGTEVARLKQKAADMKLGNVTFMPAMPMDAIGALLDHADALLVHLRDDPLFAITMPSKIQAYMFAGKPIIAGVVGNAGDLVQQAQCGMVAVPQNPQSIAQAMLDFAAMPAAERVAMGQRGRDFYDRELCLSSAVKRIVALMQRVTSRAS